MTRNQSQSNKTSIELFSIYILRSKVIFPTKYPNIEIRKRFAGLVIIIS